MAPGGPSHAQIRVHALPGKGQHRSHGTPHSVGEADHSHHAEEGCETAEKIRQDETREITVLGTILLIILILILIGSLPTWPYSAGWGYYPSSSLGLVVIIVLILVLLGRL